jgi:DNA mismatch repair protein MutL
MEGELTMKKQIKELSESLSNMIAAGEVVERPSSVIKELVENSLDAEADFIRIDLTDGGLKKMIVLDNGFGMTKDEIPVAIKRHATSKIASVDDLFSISSLGFRGEALPSIASVSQMSITSSTNGLDGTEFIYDAGECCKEAPCAMTKGTRIEVNHLFYNTPARFKNLGNPYRELTNISLLITKMALGRPDVGFLLTNNGKTIFQTSGKENQLEVVADAYGEDVAKGMLFFNVQSPLYHIQGLTSTNSIFRSNKNGINIYVNHRLVRNQSLIYAITDAYRSIYPVGKYPICVLNIDCDYGLVDVNVHPSKLEIRFTDEAELRRQITECILSKLNQSTLIYDTALDSTTQKKDFLKEQENSIEDSTKEKQSTVNKDLDSENVWNQFKEDKTSDISGELTKDKSPNLFDNLLFDNSLQEESTLVIEKDENKDKAIEDDDDFYYEDVQSFPKKTCEKDQEESFVDDDSQNDYQEEKENDSKNDTNSIPNTLFDSLNTNKPTKEKFMFQSLHYLGQYHETYLLMEKEDNLYLIDQHAAMERCRYEKIRKIFEETTIKSSSTTLLVPITLNFDRSEMLELEKKQSEIEAFGILFDVFGNNQIIIRSIPSWIHQGEEKEDVEEIISAVLGDKKMNKALLYDDLAKSMACKGSIKAHMKILPEEVKSLMKSLDACVMPYTCPHGRPTMISFTLYEIEKFFKRVM